MLVLGLDGASPLLIDRWIDQLPTFRRFAKEGVFGQTIPPIPAQTPVAWSTFMTGKNPGNHGVFSFAMRGRGTYERKIIEPETLKSKILWQILNEEGKKSVIINIPMADAVEGVLTIPGFLSRREGTPYPERLREEIRQRFKIERLRGDVETDVLEMVQADPDLFFEKVAEITDEMADVTSFMLREEKWDFFMCVFMGLDRIQHFFWKYVDPNHPRYEESRYGKLVKDFYIRFDRIAGNFLESVDMDTWVMVVSDHGFCPIHTEVILNNYLEEEGFLFRGPEEVDVKRSKAISYGYGDIWLNVKGREPNGIIAPGEEYEATRSDIMECLKGISIDGKRPIKDVKKREEIWWGLYLDEAPDLTAIFNVGYQAARRPMIAGKNEMKRYVNSAPRWSGGHDGTHDPEDVPGIIGILGDGVPRGKEIKINLWDIAPTILDLMDVPIPADMDGKPLRLK